MTWQKKCHYSVWETTRTGQFTRIWFRFLLIYRSRVIDGGELKGAGQFNMLAIPEELWDQLTER
jgi:hypothetical protein